MIHIVDLTRESAAEPGAFTAETRTVPLRSDKTSYTGVVYTLHADSMSGTYLDLPGHIRETDDGMTAANFPIENLYRVPATLIRLHRRSGSGAVSAAELADAAGSMPSTPALIINALGDLNPHDVAHRSVHLDAGAVDWIIANGCRLLVSDIYESPQIEGVFLKLFAAGISTLCEPVNLGQIASKKCRLTILFPKFPELTQIPCRALAEWETPDATDGTAHE